MAFVFGHVAKVMSSLIVKLYIEIKNRLGYKVKQLTNKTFLSFLLNLHKERKTQPELMGSFSLSVKIFLTKYILKVLDHMLYLPYGVSYNIYLLSSVKSNQNSISDF